MKLLQLDLKKISGHSSLVYKRSLSVSKTIVDTIATAILGENESFIASIDL